MKARSAFLRLTLLTGVFLFSTLLLLFLPTVAGSNPKSLFLGSGADWFVDSEARSDEAVLAEADRLFSKSDGRVVNRGVAGGLRQPFWLRIAIPEFKAEAGQSFTLSLEESRVREAVLYIEKDGQRRRLDYAAGRPDPITGFPTRFFTRTLPGDEWAGATVFLKVLTASSKRAILWFEPEEIANHREVRQSLFFGVLFGVQLALFAYLLGTGLSLRDPALISLGLLSLFYFSNILADRSFLETVVWSGAVQLARYVSFFGTFAAFAAWLNFQKAYLQVQQWSPRLAKVLTFSVIANVALAIGTVVDSAFDLYMLRQISAQIGLLNIALTAVATVAALWKNTWRGLVFLLAWAPSLSTIAARLMLDARPGAVEGLVPVQAVYIGVMIGLLTFAIVLSLDIRDREVRLRRQAEANADKLKDYAAAASDGFFETNAEGILIEHSGAAAQAFTSGIGHSLVAHVDSPANADSIRLVRQSLDFALPFRAVLFRKEAADGARLFEISGTPVATGFRGIVSDVTERERVKANREREMRFAAIGQLAGNLAHDINNLLHPIINLSRRVRDRLKDDEAGRYYLDTVTKAGERASTVVAGFLASAHGSKDFLRRVPLAVAIREISSELLVIVAERCHVVSQIDDVQEPVVQVSEVYQLMSNLVSNAVQACEAGNGVVTIALVRSGRSQVRLEVRDNGIGMDEATLKRLDVAHFTTKAPGQGTGLGLGIVREIAGRWGAHLAIASTPGQGTSATLTFDLNRI